MSYVYSSNNSMSNNVNFHGAYCPEMKNDENYCVPIDLLQLLIGHNFQSLILEMDLWMNFEYRGIVD